MTLLLRHLFVVIFVGYLANFSTIKKRLSSRFFYFWGLIHESDFA